MDTISFAGRTWNVSSYEGFSNDARQIWVDTNGWLHLKLSQDTGSWKNVEVVSRDVLGYGTYTWVAQGVHAIDKNVVLGMFPYLDNNHEMDIEQAQWGNNGSETFNFSVQPLGSDKDIFTIPYTALDTTYMIDWRTNQTTFRITEESIIQREFVSHQSRNATGVRAIINLWQSYGQPPSDGQPVEYVFKDFRYQPAQSVPFSDNNGTGNGNSTVIDNSVRVGGVNGSTSVTNGGGSSGTFFSMIASERIYGFLIAGIITVSVLLLVLAVVLRKNNRKTNKR
ncbi:MAG: hypothetical protein ABR986_05990 [Methanomassiliicoccales archaeon]